MEFLVVIFLVFIVFGIPQFIEKIDEKFFSGKK